MAAVSVFELECGGSGGFGKELVAHAYTADGFADTDCLADVCHGGFCHVGVAGSVGNEQSVVGDGCEVVVPWYHDDTYSAPCETPDDVVLHAAVYEYDGLVAVAVYLDFLAADLCHEVLTVGVVERNVGCSVDDDFAEHGAFFA